MIESPLQKPANESPPPVETRSSVGTGTPVNPAEDRSAGAARAPAKSGEKVYRRTVERSKNEGNEGNLEIRQHGGIIIGVPRHCGRIRHIGRSANCTEIAKRTFLVLNAAVVMRCRMDRMRSRSVFCIMHDCRGRYFVRARKTGGHRRALRRQPERRNQRNKQSYADTTHMATCYGYASPPSRHAAHQSPIIDPAPAGPINTTTPIPATRRISKQHFAHDSAPEKSPFDIPTRTMLSIFIHCSAASWAPTGHPPRPVSRPHQ